MFELDDIEWLQSQGLNPDAFEPVPTFKEPSIPEPPKELGIPNDAAKWLRDQGMEPSAFTEVSPLEEYPSLADEGYPLTVPPSGVAVPEPEEEREPGTLETLMKGIGRGAMGIISGMGSMEEWLRDIIPGGKAPVDRGVEEALTEMGLPSDLSIKGLKDEAERLQVEGPLARDPRIYTDWKAHPIKRAIGVIGEAGPSFAAAMGLSILTGQPWAGAWFLGAVEGAPQYEEARQAGKGKLAASVAGTASTIGTALLEYLPIEAILKGFPGKGSIAAALIGGSAEAGQELAQTLWQNLIAKVGYEPTRNLAEGWIESMIGGFGMGAPGAFISSKYHKAVEQMRQAGVTEEERQAAEHELSEQVEDLIDEAAPLGPEWVEPEAAGRDREATRRLRGVFREQAQETVMPEPEAPPAPETAPAPEEMPAETAIPEPTADIKQTVRRGVLSFGTEGEFAGTLDKYSENQLRGVAQNLDIENARTKTIGELREDILHFYRTNQAATAPESFTPQPTEAQIKAGTYKKGKIKLHGLDISVENPKGSTRRGVSPEGVPWETTLTHDYGYIRSTQGKDGDQLDVFVGPSRESEKVFVVDQVDPKTGKFDEHKVMMGFTDEAAAREGYLSNYEEGWQGLGAISGMTIPDFKEWIKMGPLQKPAEAVKIAPESKQPLPVPETPGELEQVAGAEERKALKGKTTELKPEPERQIKPVDKFTIRELTDEERRIVAEAESLSGRLPKGIVRGSLTNLINRARKGAFDKESFDTYLKLGYQESRKKPAKVEPRTIISWVKSKGGIWDPSLRGETNEFNAQQSGVVGLVSSKTGKPFDELAAMAREEGVIGPDESHAELVDLLRKGIRAAKEGRPRAILEEEELEKEIKKELAKEPMPEAEAKPAQVEPFRAQKGIGAKQISQLLHDLKIQKKVMEGEDYYAKVRNDPYMDLVIERHLLPDGMNEGLYFTHYYEQAGDLVLDTEMVWRVRGDGTLELEEVATQSLRGGEVRTKDASFARVFARNLVKQGFGEGQLVTREELQPWRKEPEVKPTKELVPARPKELEGMKIDVPEELGLEAWRFSEPNFYVTRSVDDKGWEWGVTGFVKLGGLGGAKDRNDAFSGKARDVRAYFFPHGGGRIIGNYSPKVRIEVVFAQGIETDRADAQRIIDAAKKYFEALKAKEAPAEELKPKELKATPSQQIADYVEEQLRTTTDELNALRFWQSANEAYGGSRAEGAYDVKQAYDALELGVNQYVLKGVALKSLTGGGKVLAKAQIRRLGELLKRLPSQTSRTEEQLEYQQFSTPPHYAFLANWVANIHAGEQYLEPSAGTFSLGVFGQVAGAEVAANELHENRHELLELSPFGLEAGKNLFQENAEHIDAILKGKVKPTVIVMNPPFSATAGRLSTRQVRTGSRHVERALRLLEDNGRLVAIVGRGMAPDAPAFTDWWSEIQGQYNVRANVGIPKQVYGKYGTQFGTRLLVIDKTGPTPEGETVQGEAESLEDAIDILKGVRDERIPPGERVRAKPTVEEVPPTKRPGARRGEAVSPPIGEVGPGEREPGAPVGEPTRPPGKAPVVEGPEKGPGLPPGERAEGGRRPGPSPEAEGLGPSGVRIGTASQPPGRKSPGLPSTERPTGEFSLEKQAEETKHQIEIEAKHREQRGELTEEVFETYQPERIKIPGAQGHPTPLVQSAAMAAVDLPTITYKPDIPAKIVREGRLSDIQLEAIAYAGQAHEQTLADGSRRGYAIGDGTGVGKGREIAGIILDNWNKGRKKAVWLSENLPLAKDAKRDINGIGWSTGARSLFTLKGPYDAIDKKQGIMFATYGTLRASEKKEGGKSRLDQIVEWLGTDFDGVVAFDESHNMGNAVRLKLERGYKEPSQRALAGLELQERLPNARILYVSATMATEVSNLSYAERLGLWGEGTPFSNKERFINRIAGTGVSAMEMVAMNMKALGAYMARSLSYRGINGQDVEYDRLEHNLSDKQRAMYDKLAEAWQIVLENVNAAIESNEGGGVQKRNAYSAFWGGHQRFFNQILTSMQMGTVLKHAEKEFNGGNAIVFQVVNTLEASQERALSRLTEEDGLDDLDLSPREILMGFLERSFPVAQYETYEDENGNIQRRPVRDSEGRPVQNPVAVALRERLLDEIGAMRELSLANPIDMLIEKFGAENMAEITGRKRRVVEKDTPQGREKILEKRTDKTLSKEADEFDDGKRRILLFSEKGGTGRSYHADYDIKNQRKRTHYLLQPGWRADKAVQGLGRTHRSNQRHPPKYILATTDIPGQKRFVSSIARRLDQLGALTKGQRQTGSQGIFQARDNLESGYASDALRNFFVELHAGRIPGMDIQTFEAQTALKLTNEEGQLLATLPRMKDFLNRLLSMKIADQNIAFDAFSTQMDLVIQAHIDAGTMDVGLETITGTKVTKVAEEVVHTDERSGALTSYVQFDVERPAPLMTFEEAKEYSARDGFYQNNRSKKIWAGRRFTATDEAGELVDRFVLRSPTKGRQVVVANVVEDAERWTKLTKKEAKRTWDNEYGLAPKRIISREHLVTGALLPVWDRIVGYPAIRRIQTTDTNERFIGRRIDETNLRNTLRNLGTAAAKIEMSPAEVHRRVLHQGYSVTLANEWEIARRTVGGEDRIEIYGPDWTDMRILEKHGVFSERVGGWTTRYFIPSEPTTGVPALEAVMLNRPVVEAQAPRGAKLGLGIGETISDLDPSYSLRRLRTAKERGKVTELVTIEDIQKLFKGQHVGRSADGTYWVRTVRGHGLKIKSVARITENKAAIEISYGRQREDGEMIAGKYQDGVVELHRYIADKWTLGHESIHWMEEVGILTPMDVAIIRAAIRDEVKAGRFNPYNPKDVGGKEDRAQFLADQLMREDNPTGIKKVIAKIREWVDRFVNLWRRTSRGIIRDIRSGEIYGRHTKPASGKGLSVLPRFEIAPGIWYSQMRNVISTKLPGKGTPAAMKEAIESYGRKGDFKAEELEWSGVLDWLDSLEGKKVGKQEVLDWLDSSMIVVTDSKPLTLVEPEDADFEDAEIIQPTDKWFEDEAEFLLDAYPEDFKDAYDPMEAAIERARHSYYYDNPTHEYYDRSYGYRIQGAEDHGYLILKPDGQPLLDSHVPTVPEAIDYVNNHVRETRKEWQPAPRYSEYTLPGGEDYEEMLFQLPDPQMAVQKQLEAVNLRSKEIEEQRRTDPALQEEYDRLEAKRLALVDAWLRAGKNVFKSTHWDKQSNVLAHARFNTRFDTDGKKVLFVEEIQSDWHSEGYKHGYREGKDFEKEARQIEDRKVEIRDSLGGRLPNIDDGALYYEYSEISQRGYQISKTVPDAPFKATWPLLVMKRLIRHAAENGFDRLAWTPGTMQVRRYETNIRQQVDVIDWARYGNQVNISAFRDDYPVFAHSVPVEGSTYIGDEEVTLESLLGKEMASHIRKSDAEQGEFGGDDLTIAGEFFKLLYDKKLPQDLGKFVKKWNSKVGKTSIIRTKSLKDGWYNLNGEEVAKELLELIRTNYPDMDPVILPMPQRPGFYQILDQRGAELYDVHAIDITPEMKQSAIREGLPLFSVRRMFGDTLGPKGLWRRDLWGKDQHGRGEPPPGVDITSESEEVERRIRAAKGVPRPDFRGRVRESMSEAWKAMTRHRKHLDPVEDAQIIDVLYQAERIPEFSHAIAFNALRQITNKLPDWKFDVFTRALILPDLLQDVDAGMFEDKEGLPFGYEDRDQVARDTEKFLTLADRDPDIRVALKARSEMMRKLRDELIENNLLPEDILQKPAYFHHQVLEYMAAKRMTPGTSSKDVRLTKKGWQIARRGSIKDYNTDYLQSEFEVVAQGVAQLEMLYTMDKVQELGDIKAELSTKAKAENVNLMYERSNPPRGDGTIPAPGDPDFTDPFKDYKAAIARSNSRLAKLAYDGQLWAPEKYQDVVEELRESHAQHLEEKAIYGDEPDMVSTPGSSHPLFFKYLAWLAGQPSEAAGNIQALTIFKAIGDRNRLIREALGKDFKTFRDFIGTTTDNLGDSYTSWKSERGTQFYVANSITDKMLDQVREGVRAPEDIEVQRVLARRPAVEWVIPTRLARTLNEFRSFPQEDGIFAKASAKILTSWKQWILMNPFRVVKYNLNNMSGDLDISLAYIGPEIFKYAKGVIADKSLWRWQWKRESTPEIDNALRKGVIGSGFTMTEIPDISEEGVFKILTGERPNLIWKTWKGLRGFTNWRENVLRLAAYRWFRDQRAKGRTGLLGASKAKEVQRLEADPSVDKDDIDAKLARELIGDYGNISEAGQWLRRYMVPFWSWMEINAPRYVRLFKNLKHEPDSKRLSKLGGATAWKATKLGLKASMLWGLVMLWNATFFPDEEEELKIAKRRQLHLILGRREDGKIISLRFQGALSDALGWFGFEELPYDIGDLASGTTLSEKLREKGWLPDNMAEYFDLPPLRRVVQGSRPLIRSVGEMLTGRTLWPEISRPRPIRDRAEHLARTLSLQMPYKYLAGKPSRGFADDLANLITYSTDPGEAAYYAVRSLGIEYLRRQGVEAGEGLPTSRANALYYYKKALVYGEPEKARKYLEEYKRLGGTAKGMKASIKLAHPLATVPKKYRSGFVAGLSPEQAVMLRTATTWYNKTYRGRAIGGRQ